MKHGRGAIVVAATGDSFTQAQADLIEIAQAQGRCRVIAISDNWRRLPHADMLYACDTVWWDEHFKKIKRSGFAGEMWTQQKKAATAYGLNLIEGRPGSGLSRDPRYVINNKNGGAQGIGLAYHYGARRIVLAGFDMKKGPTGKQHWFGAHPQGLANELAFKSCIISMGVMAKELSAAGVEVINATLDTALHCFKRLPLDEALF